MNKLKRCPCGEIPSALYISDAGQGGKWAYVYGDCCNVWEVEFRSHYHDTEGEKCMLLAVEAWNEAIRDKSL